VLGKLLGALAPRGVCVFTMGGLDAPSEKIDASMGPPMYYATLGIPAALALLTEGGCSCRHLEYDQRPELHVYIIAQRQASPADTGAKDGIYFAGGMASR
jgi:hypothetical protein